jgi:hypothetical protein
MFHRQGAVFIQLPVENRQAGKQEVLHATNSPRQDGTFRDMNFIRMTGKPKVIGCLSDSYREMPL